MYQMEPPRHQQPGGCRDGLVMTRVVFAVLMPVLLSALGGLVLLAVAIWLFAVHPALALIPVALVALGLAWLARRDRRLQRDREADARPRPPP